MLPSAHIAYTWLALDLAQQHLDAPEIDYRAVALAATGSDLIDKPLALAYFYERYKSAVLFAHTLLVYSVVLIWGLWPGRSGRSRVLALAFVGHAILDRLWHFQDTFYWPFRGWRFTQWGKRGSEQEKIGLAYWYAFTRRPELWGWEMGSLLALAWFAWRNKLWRWENLQRFLWTGRV